MVGVRVISLPGLHSPSHMGSASRIRSLHRTASLTGALIAVALAGAFAAPARADTSPVVMLVTWRGCEEACQGFKSALKVRSAAPTIVHRDAGQDAAAIPAIVDEARRVRPDVVVTWGNEVTLGFIGPIDAVDPKRHLTDIPVVYMYVAEPVASGIARSAEETGRPNVAGTDYSVPLSAKFRAMNDYRRLSRLGMLFDPTQSGSVERRDAIASEAAARNVAFVARALPLSSNGRPDPSRIDQAVDDLVREGVDWIYFGVSSFLIENADAFSEAVVRRGVPMFSGGELPVRNAGGLFGLAPSLHQIGALAALQVDRILDDPETAPGSRPVERKVEFQLIVNMRAATALALYPPLAMFRVLDVVN